MQFVAREGICIGGDCVDVCSVDGCLVDGCLVGGRLVGGRLVGGDCVIGLSDGLGVCDQTESPSHNCGSSSDPSAQLTSPLHRRLRSIQAP